MLLWIFYCYKACNKNRKYFNVMPWLWLEVWVTFLHKFCQWCIRYDGSLFFSVKSNKSWRIPIKIKVQNSFTLISPDFTLISLAPYHWIPYTGRPSLFWFNLACSTDVEFLTNWRLLAVLCQQVCTIFPTV